MTDQIPAEALIERLFDRICAEEPLSHITRADIQRWVSLLESEGWSYLRPVPSRDEIADEVSGIQVGSGYYATVIGRDAALDAADAVLALFEGASND